MINESNELNELAKQLTVDKLIQIADMHISRMFKIVDIATKGILLGRSANGREIQHITDYSDPNGLHEFYFIGSVDEVANRLKTNQEFRINLKEMPPVSAEQRTKVMEELVENMKQCEPLTETIRILMNPDGTYQIPPLGPAKILTPQEFADTLQRDIIDLLGPSVVHHEPDFEINDDLVQAVNNLGCKCNIEDLRAAIDAPSFIYSQIHNITKITPIQRQVSLERIKTELRNLKIKAKFAELISLIGTTAYDDRVHAAVQQIELAQRCLFA